MGRLGLEVGLEERAAGEGDGRVRGFKGGYYGKQAYKRGEGPSSLEFRPSRSLLG